jgi:quercetin dioxygenase-like cupin family protein
MLIKRWIVALLAASILPITGPVLAHDGEVDQERVVPLLRQALPDAAGRNGIMLTVNYAPGQASAPHSHPGSVFAYVLEGEVVSQLQGQPAVTYKAGDYWYEPPQSAHIVSRNASTSAPARLLVWLLVGDGEQAKLPLPK